MLNYRRVYLDLEILGTFATGCRKITTVLHLHLVHLAAKLEKTPFRLAVGPGMPWSLTDWIISEAVATYS